MPFLFRFSTFAACAVVGAAIPLLTVLNPQHSAVSPSLAFHTSSRMVTMDAVMPSAELEQLRSQIWALTQQGGTIHCSVDGITAPCIDASAQHQID